MSANTITVLRVTKLTNSGYIPVGSTGFAIGEVKEGLGFLVGWEYEPHVIYPVYKDEIELGERITISVDNRTNAIIDCWRKLPPEFEINVYK
jgi:hypothetical protein